MTFLQQTAQRIFDRHGPSMNDVWVILPTRRAVSVFLSELARLSDRPFVAPHTLAVDDFITQAAGVQLIDQVSLLFELYDVFSEIDPAIEFEQFVGWASVLLADFDRIDQNLVKASPLFEYMTAAKALERWQPDQLTPSGSSMVETPGAQRYFRLFENMHRAYKNLRKRLEKSGLAYRGMAYRNLAENVGELIRDNLAYECVYFVGFNALSRAEEKIISVLREAEKAELIWDADQYYLNDPNQEAGYFLRRYQKEGGLFSKENRQDLKQANYLTGTEKNIRIVGVPNASMQAKVAGKIYKEWEGEEMDEREGGSQAASFALSSSPKTAIVLADETLLIPVLYALDENVTSLNVTMGLSLKSSLLFTLIDTLFEMQRTVQEFRAKDDPDRRVTKYHHRHVVKLLNHPFLKQYERINNLLSPVTYGPNGEELPPEPLFQWMAKDIVQKQRVYMSATDLRELSLHDPLIKLLFTRWPNDNPKRAIWVFHQLVDLLREVYRVTQDAIEIEYLYLFFTLLKQLEATLERQPAGSGGARVSVKSLRQFLNDLIRQTSIPFTSEGSSSLQIMGMLETRALDFERVIVLSVNEGVLPQARKLNSLIPFDAAKQYGLPTYREQEAVMAYHFYRLLQRATDVVLLYTTTTDAYGTGKGEPSRFIRQIEHELVPRAGEKINVSYPTVRFGQRSDDAVRPVPEVQIAKTESVRALIIKKLTGNGLYPSYLNQFVSCSMRFYFSRIVSIREEEDIEEKMGVLEFGTWLHAVLERLDKEYRQQGLAVDETIIRRLLKEEFEKSMKGRVIESGMNLMLYQLAQRLMLDFQRQQSELTDLTTVISTEQTLDTWLDVPLENNEVIRVRIAGKVDRIERYQGRIRIIDYKTGKVSLDEKKNTNLTELLLRDGQEDKRRQLWMYRYLALKNISQLGGIPLDRHKQAVLPANGLPVEAGFYSFRDIKGGFKSNPVSFADGNEPEQPEQYIEQSEEILRQLIRQMLDPNEPFRKTDRIETCQYCDFKGICGR